MRVLQILPMVTTGGMESQVRRLSSALSHMGVHCHVHACAAGDQALWSQLDFPLTWGSRRGGLPGRLFRTMKAIGQVSPDIVHVHLSLSGYLAARLVGHPMVISHYHNAYPPPGRISALQLYKRRLFDRICTGDHALACSEAVRDQCVQQLGIASSQIDVLYNGIDLQEVDRLAEQPISTDLPVPSGKDVRLIFVGRLVAHKGLGDLLASLANMADGPWRLLIVGDGPLRSHLETRVYETGLGTHIRFLGARPWEEIPSLLSSSDIFVYPSHWEGLGLSIIEASACRLPVIATNVGGIPEVVAHGESGLLVPPGASDALAVALSELMEDTDRRREMGEAGRRLVEERFDIDKLATRLKGIYENLLGGAP